jgi:hypothetical protein
MMHDATDFKLRRACLRLALASVKFYASADMNDARGQICFININAAYQDLSVDHSIGSLSELTLHGVDFHQGCK